MTAQEMECDYFRSKLYDGGHFRSRYQNFKSRYQNQLDFAIRNEQEDKVNSNFRFELREWQNTILQFIDTFDGKSFDEKLKNAMAWKCDEQRTGSSTGLELMVRYILLTQPFIEKVFDKKIRYYAHLRKGQPFFVNDEMREIKLNDDEKDERTVCENIELKNIFEKPKNVTFTDLSATEKHITLLAKFKSAKSAFMSERRRLFGPKSVLAPLGLFANE